jgi:hydrogenase maturation protease
MKTIIIGLGNPILGDDGVGWKVAEEVKKQLSLSPFPSSPEKRDKRDRAGIDVQFLSLGGISLMENLIGYDRAILIDAVASEEEIGSVIVSELTELPDVSAYHLTSVHDLSLQTAIKLGKTMGAVLPERVIVVGIATHLVHDFGEELSLPVSQSIAKAARIVIELL